MKPISFSHKGKREINQDYILIKNINPDTTLCLVVDGMGGYDSGDVAAKLIAESINTFLNQVNEKIEIEHIKKAINKANLAIRQYQEQNHSKLGATIGGTLIQGNSALCFWVGDVSIFRFSNNKLCDNSTPHTLLNQLKSNGSITNPATISKYKHVVTQSVQGDIKKSIPEFFEVPELRSTDLIVICSDGVTDILDSVSLMKYIISQSLLGGIEAIEERLKNEAKDNYSMIVIES